MASDAELFAAAEAVRARAYAPYSRFAVGAAILADDGRVYAGCNVENAAYPIGNCAEASAIAAMIAGGGRRIRRVYVTGPGAVPVTPCGGCRQRIREPRCRRHKSRRRRSAAGADLGAIAAAFIRARISAPMM